MKKINLHDSFSERDTTTALPTNRSFGKVFVVFFALVAIFPLFFGKGLMLWAAVTSFIILLVTLIIPQVLRPFNWLWMKFGLLLHCVVSPVILGVIFFLVVTPTAFLIRLAGKDPLRLKSNTQESYWLTREEPLTKESLKNQF